MRHFDAYLLLHYTSTHELGGGQYLLGMYLEGVGVCVKGYGNIKTPTHE